MEIKLTFLTPTFLYGADKNKPEFRIPSLIGQMRYWWRMTQEWPKDVKILRKAEAEVFGLGDKGAKPFYMWKHKSDLRTESSKAQDKPVNIKFYEDNLPDNFEAIQREYGKRLSYNQEKQKLFFNGFMTEEQSASLKAHFGHRHKESIEKLYDKAHRYFFDIQQNGLSYLFYPFNQNRSEPFSWLVPGSSVHLKLEFLNEESKLQVLLSLFLLARFGGLGSRSRRGAGAIEVTSDCELFTLTEEQLRDYINSTDRERLATHKYFAFINPSSPLFKALADSERWFRISTAANTWRDTLEPVGSTMQAFRTKRNLRIEPHGRADADFKAEAIALHRYYTGGPAPHRLSKDAFGLPRIINFTSGVPYMNALTITPFWEDDSKEGRRASPLHITVNRRKDNRYYCTLLILWEGLEFLPEEERQRITIRIKKDNNADIVNFPRLENPGPDKLIRFLERIQ